MPEHRDDDVVICSAVRTPIGKFMGAMSSVPSTILGVCVRPSHLDGRHEACGPPQEAGDQRCGSNSSMRVAGCVGSLSSTSLKYA